MLRGILTALYGLCCCFTAVTAPSVLLHCAFTGKNTNIYCYFEISEAMEVTNEITKSDMTVVPMSSYVSPDQILESQISR